ncbi:hypothetical protein PH586_09810 [Pseudomonas sp. SA3-5]|uniref:Uncharacterized protein n=1 Tax=Pseudomonas aestuarii TaxID=3018340 RepID=A0ABT4XEM3_9PSED|nr:hypothetical protein [Pseudomonas aestuarii]MDA7086673.1 hypothetical protein [Pseudomonas aestuarii]
MIVAAMQAGTLDAQQPVVGGGMGMRYIITGSTIVEHGSSDGPLLDGPACCVHRLISGGLPRA